MMEIRQLSTLNQAYLTMEKKTASLSKLLDYLPKSTPTHEYAPLFKTVCKSLGAPLDDLEFGKTHFFGDSPSDRKVRLQALKHILNKNTSACLSLIVNALQSHNKTEVIKLLNRIKAFSPHTLRKLTRLNPGLMRNLSGRSPGFDRYALIVEKTLVEEILGGWAEKGAANENRLSAKTSILDSMNSSELNIRNCNLSKIPKVFHLSCFKNLKKITLNNNRLSSLDRLAPLRNLTDLNASYNCLKSFSKLDHLTALERLSLDHNFLIEAPSLGSFKDLNFCDISDNLLSALPPIPPLESLETFNLTSNLFLEIDPLALSTLPEGCSVILSETPEIDSALGVFYEALFASGKNLTITTPEDPLSSRVNREIKFLYAAFPEKEVPYFLELTKVETNQTLLLSWLSALRSDLIHFSEETTRKALKTSVIRLLNKAETDKPFRDFFFPTIQDAMTSCINGRTLSILQLSIAELQFTVDMRDQYTTFAQLKKLVIFKLLSDAARDKIEALKLEADTTSPTREARTARYAEIHEYEKEVFLIFPLKLATHYDLPLHQTELFFEPRIGTSPEEIETVKARIDHLLESPDALHGLMVENDTWVKLLKLHRPAHYPPLESLEDRIKASQDLLRAPTLLSLSAESMKILDRLLDLEYFSSPLKILEILKEIDDDITISLIDTYNERREPGLPRLKIGTVSKILIDIPLLVEVTKSHLSINDSVAFPPSEKRVRLG